MNKYSPIKASKNINYNISSDYIIKLQNDIPILLDGYLLNLIFQYINDTSTMKSSNKENIIKNGILNKIDKYLIVANTMNIVELENNKYTKIHNFEENNLAHGLIESIIHSTLNYYDIKENLNISVAMKVNIKNKKLYQKMNISKGILLNEFIIQLYGNNNIENKNNFLLIILQKIAYKLSVLQELCGFIHGDFHSGNIFINIIENDVEITFIDFGYSVINLPNDSNQTILLCAPVSQNISRKYMMNLKEEPLLKAVDLFHLIENLKSFENSNNINKIIKFDQFIKLIDEVRKLYFSNFDRKIVYSRNYSTRHNFTASQRFFEKINYNLENSFEYLFPDNFIKLALINDKLNTNNITLTPIIKFSFMEEEEYIPKKEKRDNVNKILLNNIPYKRPLFGNNNL